MRYTNRRSFPFYLLCVFFQPKAVVKTEDLIQDAIEQQLALCQCPQWYPVQRIDEGVYLVCSMFIYLL